MDLFEISCTATNARSLLDLVSEYLLSGQTGRTDSEKLETVLYAVEAARDQIRAAEAALLSIPPDMRSGILQALNSSSGEEV